MENWHHSIITSSEGWPFHYSHFLLRNKLCCIILYMQRQLGIFPSFYLKSKRAYASRNSQVNSAWHHRQSFDATLPVDQYWWLLNCEILLQVIDPSIWCLSHPFPFLLICIHLIRKRHSYWFYSTLERGDKKMKWTEIREVSQGDPWVESKGKNCSWGKLGS